MCAHGDRRRNAHIDPNAKTPDRSPVRQHSKDSRNRTPSSRHAGGRRQSPYTSQKRSRSPGH
eukprot:6855688-Pyramimonas_sp.AAC.1